MSLDRQPGRAALVYGLALAALLLAPLDPHDASTHGFLRVGRYDTTWRLVKDVVQNLVVFAPFGFLLRRTLARATPGSTAPIIAPVLIATAFALAMESMQSVIPGRYSAITDVMLDAAGAALGAACEPWLRAREPVTSLGDGLAP